MPAKFTYDLAEHLTFRDRAVCERVRRIPRAELCRHPRPNVKVRVIEDDQAFAFAYCLHIVAGIKQARDAGRRHVIILPAPNPNYALVAQMINALRLPCDHVHTFNMDEYADQDGKTAPRDWRGGFQYWMWHDLFSQLDPALKVPEKQIHFPSSDNVNDYSRMLADLGGAHLCYGGTGWCGHIAFFEPHLGIPYEHDLEGYLRLGTQIVDLHPITVCQNSLYGDAGGAGDWSWVPPKAASIGPADIAGAKLVSWWNGFRAGEGVWQRFITRLSLHGPVTPLVPASILQLFNTELTLSGFVADDCSQDTYERRVPVGVTQHSANWGQAKDLRPFNG